MKNWKPSYVEVLIGLIVFLSGCSVVIAVMPNECFFYGNADVDLSPVGMALSKAYFNYFDLINFKNQGYINNGEFHFYRNWPPLHFWLLSKWYGIVGVESIQAARYFSVIIYGITSLFFYWLLVKKHRLSIRVSLISSIVFMLLPVNLESSYYIYSDIWVNLFWLLAILLLANPKKLYFGVFAVVCVIGFFFHWFIIFLLPAYITYHILSKVRHGKVNRFFIFSFFFIVILSLVFLHSISTDSTLILALEEHSTLGLFNGNAPYLWMGTKQMVLLFFSVFVLFFLKRQFSKLSLKSLIGLLKTEQYRGLWYSFSLIIIALLILLVFMLQWFVVHRHAFMFLSVPLGLCFAYFLSIIEERSSGSIILLGLSSIIICVAQYLILYGVTYYRHGKIQVQDENISEFIVQRKPSKSLKSNIFFNINSSINNRRRINKFAIRERTDSYIFELDSLLFVDRLDEQMVLSIQKLKALNALGADESSAFLITERLVDYGDLRLIDSAVYNNIIVYQLDVER